MIALLAVLLAVVSLLVAALALKKAGDATSAADVLAARLDRAAPAGAQPTADSTVATAEPTSTGVPSTGTDTTDPGPTTTPTIDPKAVFEVKYTGKDMQVQLSSARYIDLDAPKVDDRNEADIYLSDSVASAVTLHFSDGVTAADASALTTPNECVDKLTLSPIDAESTYSLRKGDSICVLTSAAAAQARADNQQIVLLTIKSVAIGKTVVLTANAWKVPN
jgi:hypothetical protein